ncbi:hypothetical protein BRE01_17040 [Brevibacillus reuszeri]|uniref:Uncharacterized protein n=1 Tax=Brevibacillus reuszeri TaxID=54915 RepID=A0ABQ0TJF8_9BACL|nr:hypothetical protein BRE01_17040 [Brevibacillus reuszeri]
MCLRFHPGGDRERSNEEEKEKRSAGRFSFDLYDDLEQKEDAANDL